MLKSVDDIIEALGGTSAVAKRAGVSPSAVSNWRALGSIPAEYFLAFEAWAGERGVRLDPSVFGFKNLEPV